LKRLISVPVNAGEILELMCGRIPLGDDSRSELRMKKTGKEYVLDITDLDTKKIDRVHFLNDKLTVFKFERVDKNGRLTYRSIFEKMQKFEDFVLPTQMRLFNEAGLQLDIEVDRCWVNPNLGPRAFILKPPESEKVTD
ncbi:MAG: DUF4292 domain-containing protein, partial [Deltaproteobacteria bacterium]|nr:DUF4292 domain-containing protein [Deltaproteobacteria bacterium]